MVRVSRLLSHFSFVGLGGGGARGSRTAKSKPSSRPTRQPARQVREVGDKEKLERTRLAHTTQRAEPDQRTLATQPPKPTYTKPTAGVASRKTVNGRLGSQARSTKQHAQPYGAKRNGGTGMARSRPTNRAPAQSIKDSDGVDQKCIRQTLFPLLWPAPKKRDGGRAPFGLLDLTNANNSRKSVVRLLTSDVYDDGDDSFASLENALKIKKSLWGLE